MEKKSELKNLPFLLPLNNPQKCVEEAEKMVLILRPQWTKQGLNNQFFTEGVTNKILSIWHEDSGPNDRILIRIFGERTELVIDRVEELRNWELLIKHGCAPPIYCQFSNGLAYGFVAGMVLDTETVREKKIATAVAKSLVKQHMISHGNCGDTSTCIFRKARGFIKNMPTSFQESGKQRRFVEEFPTKERILSELELIEKTVLPLNSPIVFCHNDLLLKNIVYSPDRDTASFIDYEYSGFNFQAFDIADHFSEFVGIENMDYEKMYPDRKFQMDWLETYLRFWHESTRRHPPTEKDVERLYVQVNKFTPLAHFFWSVWATVQSAHSTIDFDFLDYGIQRWKEYERTKGLFFSLQMPE